MGTTPTYAFPYPEPSDAPAGDQQIKALAEAVEARGLDGTFKGAKGDTGATGPAGPGTVNVWSPQALGFKAWSVDPAGVANPATKALVPQRLYLSGINITEATSVNTVVMFARGWAGSTAVPAARFAVAIYNASGARLGTSGIVSSVPAPGANGAPGMKNNHIGAVPIKLTAALTLQPGKYWAAFIMTTGTATDFYYMHVQNESPSAPANFHLGPVFHRAWCLNTQTNTPATVNQLVGEVGLDPAIMALATT